MKTLVEMMDGATPEQCNALSVAVSCVWKRERDKMKNRARRRKQRRLCGVNAVGHMVLPDPDALD